MTDTLCKHPPKKKVYSLNKNDRWRYSFAIIRCPFKWLYLLLNLVVMNKQLPSTVTLKSCVVSCPAASADVYVTMVTPMLNEKPGVCVDVKVWIPELSTATGSIQITRAVGNP